jgi:hypothetical protein
MGIAIDRDFLSKFLVITVTAVGTQGIRLLMNDQ